MKKIEPAKAIVRVGGFGGAQHESLEDYCDRKSFYRKAKVVDLEAGEGESGKVGLVSYDTLVATVTEKKDGTTEFSRTWGGWSATTGRHVSSFARMFGFGVGKAEWDRLEAIPVDGWYCGYRW